jgi:hypothetical protein
MMMAVNASTQARHAWSEKRRSNDVMRLAPLQVIVEKSDRF